MPIRYIVLLASLSLFISCKGSDTSQSYVKVYKDDGSIQCENPGIDLDVMALELINAGIDVVCSQKGGDGLVRPALCGIGGGSLNIYKIHIENLPDAEVLGFQSVDKLKAYQDEPCE